MLRKKHYRRTTDGIRHLLSRARRLAAAAKKKGGQGAQQKGSHQHIFVLSGALLTHPHTHTYRHTHTHSHTHTLTHLVGTQA